MKASVVSPLCALLGLAPVSARAEDGGTIAWRVIQKHRLLSPKMLNCASVAEDDDTTKTLVKATVRELHNKRCGGDPQLAPRLFSLEINRKSGAAKWDYNSPGEMQPIPKRR